VAVEMGKSEGEEVPKSIEEVVEGEIAGDGTFEMGSSVEYSTDLLSKVPGEGEFSISERIAMGKEAK